MIRYYSKSSATGKSTGVKGYDYGHDYITVFFKSGAVYTYTVDSCGSLHVEAMKRLADAKRGLNTYIAKIRPQFAYSENCNGRYLSDPAVARRRKERILVCEASKKNR